MSTVDLLGSYVPRDTALHRTTPGPKLLALLVLSLAVVLSRSPVAAVALLAVVLVLLAWSGAGPRRVLRTLRGVLLVAVLLGGYQAWQRGTGVAVEVVADLLTLVLASLVLTTTTSIDDLLDTLVRVVGPFRRLGVDPDRVALAFSLVLRAVPETLSTALRTRDAARARGLERSPRALLVPFVLRVVADARATGDALAARGIGD